MSWVDPDTLVFRRRVRLFSTGAVASLALFAVSTAANAAPAQVSGQKNSRYQRILFQWPEDVAITAQMNGHKLIINFSHSGEFDFSRLTAALGETLQSVTPAKDGRSVVLLLNQPYRIRTFTSDHMAGVDLMEPLAAPPEPTHTQAEKTPAEPKKKRPSISVTQAESITYSTKSSVEAAPSPRAKTVTHTTKDPEPVALPATKEKPAETPAQDSNKQDSKTVPAPAEEVGVKATNTPVRVEKKLAAPEVEPKVTPAKQAKEEAPETVIHSTQPAKDESIAKLAPAAEDSLNKLNSGAGNDVAEEPLKPIAKPPKPEDKVNASEAAPTPPSSPPLATASPEPSSDNILMIVPSMNNEGGILRFSFPERTAAAVFSRAGYLWLVFNRPANVNLSLLDAQLPNQTGPAERLENPLATVIRLPFEGEAGAIITRDETKFTWQVALFSRPQITQNALAVTTHTEPPLKPHIVVPALQVAEPLTVQDPTIGDELIIVPSYKAGEGIAPQRQFVDFDLMRSAQGLVVRKVSEDTAVLLLRNGVRISTRDGARISPNLPPVESSQPKEEATGKTMFPHDQWKLKEGEFFDQSIRTLFHEMALSKTTEQNSEKKLEIAQIYIDHGMGAEALGILQAIRKSDPSFYFSHKLNALSGVANFLMYRFADAAQDFAALELNGSKEIEFWRTLTAELLGGVDKHFDFLTAYPDYIKKYPPALRQRLTILAADRSIAARDYNLALKIMDTLDSPEVLDPVKAYANFLLGKISAGTGQPAAATEVWKELSENYSNPFVRASAEFSLVVQQLQAGKMDKEEVIKRLERLRIAWRGDGLELGVLLFLGNLYAERKDYAQALDAWRDVVSVFPNTVHAADVGRRMKEAFTELFLNGEADKLPPLEALALYYEYRDLTPSGKTGDEIIHRLADKLLTVDLLDQATLLLEQQMHGRQEKDERSLTGSKLATVYLLNHDPKKALDVLEQSNYGDNPEELRLRRDRLAAHAFMEMGRYREALELLADDTSFDALYLRTQIYWRQKEWAGLIQAGEALIKGRTDPTAALTSQQTDVLLKLATAYVFEHDQVQLSYLHDYFAPQMPEGPQKNVFEYLTSANIIPSPETFEQAMRQVDATKSFLETYRTRIKENSKSKAVN